jgi:enamine deaminase RidA (YjgF/YER057c/UK114 family)
VQTKDLVSEDIGEQTEQALKNMGAILEEAGSSFDKVLKTTVLLMDMGDFAKVNEVYGEAPSSFAPCSPGAVWSWTECCRGRPQASSSPGSRRRGPALQ